MSSNAIKARIAIGTCKAGDVEIKLSKDSSGHEYEYNFEITYFVEEA